MSKFRLDATAITMVKKNEGDLGKQRLFGVIGQAVFVESCFICFQYKFYFLLHMFYSLTFSQ